MLTTKDDFKYYKKCLKHYYKKFNLSGWHVFYTHAESEGLAEVVPDISGRSVNFILDVEWKDVKVTKKRLERVARHEMVHLILEPLCNLAVSRYTSRDNLCSVSEEVAQHITEILWG